MFTIILTTIRLDSVVPIPFVCRVERHANGAKEEQVKCKWAFAQPTRPVYHFYVCVCVCCLSHRRKRSDVLRPS